MKNSSRFYLRLPDEMNTALQEEAEKQNTTESAIVREALQDYFKKRGRVVKSRVNWGGKRDTKLSESE